MKHRHIRAGHELDKDDDVVLRGGVLDADTIKADAQRMFSVYGTYGVSVFALRGTTVGELAQQTPLVRFSRLTLLKVSAIRDAGLSLEPTGRNPSHCTVVLRDSKRHLTPWLPASTPSGRTPTMMGRRDPNHGELHMSVDIDLQADLNAEDDDGLGWSTLSDARAPGRVVPGALLLAGNASATAVVRVVAVDEDGQVHFTVLPGPIEKNRHLLDRTDA